MPPGNIQAEQALLGALLANSHKVYDMVCDFLEPHHFHDPVHGTIYAAIARRAMAGEVADPVTLRSELENSGQLDEVGGANYLVQLLAAMIGYVNAKDYGRLVHDAWVRRQLISSCCEIVDRAFAPQEGETGQDLIEALDGSLTGIAEGAGDIKPLIAAGDAVSTALQNAFDAGERDSPLAGLTTGYDALDRMTAGFMPGQLYVLGARPAMGKTGIGLGIAARAASIGHSVLFWSGEMSAEQMGTRLAAAHAGIDVSSVFRGKRLGMVEDVGARPRYEKLTPQEWDRLVKSQRDAARLNLHFDDRPGITVSALRARARRLKRSKKGLNLLVVDYLALMKASAHAERAGQYERTTELSRDLKLLASELGIPVIVLCQLSRANEHRDNKAPQLSDLRDSGAIEQDAYCVMFLHREHYYLTMQGEPVRGAKEKPEDYEDRRERYTHQLELTRHMGLVLVAKNRNGPTGPCRVKFNAPTIWFRDEADDDVAWGTALAA